jgi:hypothetical protein
MREPSGTYRYREPEPVEILAYSRDPNSGLAGRLTTQLR